MSKRIHNEIQKISNEMKGKIGLKRIKISKRGSEVKRKLWVIVGILSISIFILTDPT